MIANTFNANDINTSLNSLLTSSAHQLLNNHQQDDNNNPILMPLNFYKFESSLTLTDFINNTNEMKEKKLMNGVSCGLNETVDSFLADLV